MLKCQHIIPHTVILQHDHFAIVFFLPEFAMSPNSNEVHIYSKKGPKWEVETVLKNVSASQLNMSHCMFVCLFLCSMDKE